MKKYINENMYEWAHLKFPVSAYCYIMSCKCILWNNNQRCNIIREHSVTSYIHNAITFAMFNIGGYHDDIIQQKLKKDCGGLQLTYQSSYKFNVTSSQ